MPENPVGSKEQRKELRERLVASTGEHPAVFGAAEVASLLCGLDIAEEMEKLLKQCKDVLVTEPCEGESCVYCALGREIYKLRRNWQDWKQGMTPAEEER